MLRHTSMCVAGALFASMACAAPMPRFVAGPFEIDIPESFAGCNNFSFVDDQNDVRPRFQVLVNVYEETSANYRYADGTLKGHLIIQTTGAESPKGRASIIAETRGSRHHYSQLGEDAFVYNGILLIPGRASEADKDNMPMNDRRTVFTIHFDEQFGCSRLPLEEVPFVRYGECIADFNEDGGVDGSDVYDFFQAWEHLLPTADVNEDLVIDWDDVAAFFSPWENGGC